MLAPFAHHLRTAFVLLDGHGAHRTALDEIIVEGNAEGVRLAIGRQPTCVLLAGHRRVPLEKKKKKKKDQSPNSSKDRLSLTAFLQPEQKSSRQVGQCTAQGDGRPDEDAGSCTILSEDALLLVGWRWFGWFWPT